MYKVLFLTPNLSSGGAERQLVTLAILLKRHGLLVEVLCYAEGNFYSSLLKDYDIPIHWKIYNNYFSRMMGVRSFIRKGKYGCVISLLEVPNFLNNFSAIGGKTWKVITGERSSKMSTFCSKRGKIFGWFQRYADYIVCNSDNAKKMWIKYYPKYFNKLYVIYNLVLQQRITSTYIPKKNNKLHIVVAASYQKLKNSIGLINAIILMDKVERERIEINWYGRTEVTKENTKTFDESIVKIIDNKLQNIIHLYEETKDIANKMNEADIVALFSELEGLPNAICEGMMIGKPIIMTRVSDYSILINDSNGFLCNWNDAESIKMALVSSINMTVEQITEMGKRSKEKAEKLFSTETILNQWIDLV